MRRGYVLFGCIFSVFVLMMTPAVPAVEYNNVKQSSVVSITFDAFKEKLESLGCPATRILALWEIFCLFAFIFERLAFCEKPLTFAIIRACTVAIFYFGVMIIADYFTDADVTYFWERPPYDQLAIITTFISYILWLTLRMTIHKIIMSG